MKLKEFIMKAKADGVVNDKMIWQVVENMDDIMCVTEKDHPDLYWKFMRDFHALMYGCHYNETFAECDLMDLRYTDRDGRKYEGPHWTINQVEELTKGMSFPPGVTKWDRYVAMNVEYSDSCKDMDESQIIKHAYSFYFADEDWPNTSTKIWNYMCFKKGLSSKA